MRSRNNSTINDVAQLAGVSKSIVSYVLNNTPSVSITDETRERVKKAAMQLHYVPNALAQGIRQGSFPILGFLSSWNFSDTVRTIEEIITVADEMQMSTLLCPYGDDQQFRYVKLYNSHLINGLIILASKEDTGQFHISDHIEMIRKHQIPTVIVGRSDIPDDISSIDVNFADSGRIATEHLISLHHRKIAFLQPYKGDLERILIRQRLNSHLQCMEANHLTPQIVGCEDIDALLDTVKAGTGPTAVIATKSDLAHVFLQHALSKGVSIPDDLSLVSCNLDDYNRFSVPPITTVVASSFNTGALATRMLLETIRDQQAKKEQQKMPFEILPGASCRANNE